MPSPVAANDLSPISGSVQTSRISYAVEPADKNYGQNYNSTTWYSDIPNDGTRYTIVSDNYTANYYVSRSQAGGGYVEGGLPAVDEYSAPVFWVTTGTSSLDVITIVNGLPDRVGEIPFDSGSQALNWVASSSNYFAVGPDYYRDMDADQLRLFYHANQVISYPTTQSTWYDLSGYTNPNGTLTNGPVWNSNGWIEFDGTNDVVYTTPWALNNEFSYEGTFYIDPSDSSYSGFFGNMYSPSGYSFNGSGWIVRLEPAGNLEVYLRNNVTGGTRTILINSFRSTYSGKWFNLAFVSSGSTNTLYVNNTAYNGSAYTVGLISSSAELTIGAYDWGGRVETYYLNGANEYTRAYSKALSATEVAQNYYGGPIVTDGLVFAIDAGNLVSYPKSGTAAYNLTGSEEGTLTNGPTFNQGNGGYWEFDGTNDYINFGDIVDLGTSDFTLSVWVYIPSGTANTYRAILNKKGAAAANAGYGIYYNTGQQKFLWSTANGTTASEKFTSNTFADIEDTWAHVVMVRQSGATNNGHYYVNGVYQSLASAGTILNVDSSTNLSLAVAGNTYTPYCFQGNIANAKIYNRALSAEEVLQNYNATN